MAQEAKKLALAALLCRLAIGSSNAAQFERKFKETINKQRQKNNQNIPIVSGDVGDPESKQKFLITDNIFSTIFKTIVRHWICQISM